MKEFADDVIDRARTGGDDDCWPWPGASTPGGYGKIGRNGRTLYVHRVVYEGRIGPLADGFVVMHTCDNPGCCNPRHLRCGTPAENSADMVAKKRSRTGEKHPLRRITESDVRNIRHRVGSGEKQSAVAEAFGLSRQHINAVVSRKTWASVA